MSIRTMVSLILLLTLTAPWPSLADGNARKPASESDLRAWLENMIWHHRFTDAEVIGATGLSQAELEEAKKKLNITADNRPAFERKPGDPLRGRHPRVGFLDGAVDPQRETKVSAFTPWDRDSYVVVDVPEALWSNLGLTYLAHTHVPTVWSRQKIEMEKLEWKLAERKGEAEAQALSLTRKLPNGIEFAVTVTPRNDSLRMTMSLTNGSKEKVSDLRVQMCVMLKGAAGFTKQTNDNKVIEKPFVAVHDEKQERWIISAWEPCHRPWANAPVPCLHSDPKFPDLAPGEKATLRGWLSFYEGKDVKAEMKRIAEAGWSK